MCVSVCVCMCVGGWVEVDEHERTFRNITVPHTCDNSSVIPGYQCMHKGENAKLRWSILLLVWIRVPNTIDLLHKSHNVSVSYPTGHHFVTEMYKCVQLCYKMVHYGLFVYCIMGFVRWVFCDVTLLLLLKTRMDFICVYGLHSGSPFTNRD